MTTPNHRKIGKRLLLFLAAAATAQAVGTVQQSTQQVGNSGIYTVALYWTGDSVNGTVPVTLIQSQSIPLVQGYRVVNMEAAPGSPAPTNNYSIALLDAAGVDVLAGAAAALSNSTAQGFVGAASSPPIFGSISLSISGQSVANAKGSVFVYLAPFSQVIGLAPTAPSFPSQGADLFYASPCGSSGSPGFRALCATDLSLAGLLAANNSWTANNTFTGGTIDLHGSTKTLPNRSGTGSPNGRDNCATVGESYFQTDAVAGLNIWGCTTVGSPGTWSLEGTPIPSGSQTQFLRIQPNTGNNTTLQFANIAVVNPSDYNFPAQSPGTSITAGAASVTFTPCPLGVNGADTNHNLYISGGTGTSEFVLITGGTCTSGASSGTVTFTAANNHSGAYTVASVMGGLPEAGIANPGSRMFLSSSITANGPWTMLTNATLECAANTAITQAFTGATLINVPNNGVTISGCVINGNQPTGTNPLQMVFVTGNFFTLRNSTIENASASGLILTGNHATFTGNVFTGNLNGALSGANSTSTYATITNNYVNSVGCTTLNCGAISVWGSHIIVSNNLVDIGGNKDGGIAWAGLVAQGNVDATITGNRVRVFGSNTFECGVVAGSNFTFSGNVCDASAAGTNPSPAGWEFNQAAQGSIVGYTFIGVNSGATTGIFLESPQSISISGAYITGIGSGGKCVFIQQTSATVNTNHVLVEGVTCIDTLAAGVLGGDIQLDGFVAGTIGDVLITGNQIFATQTAGHICLYIANSGSSTQTNLVVKGNAITNCDTGIEVNGSGVGGLSLENNRINGAATANIALVNSATARIVDTNGGTATAIAGAATLNSMVGTITSESLVTAIGSTYTLTITDNLITSAATVLANVFLGSSTNGTPQIVKATPGAGSLVIVVKNIDGANAFNGTLKIQYQAMIN